MPNLTRRGVHKEGRRTSLEESWVSQSHLRHRHRPSEAVAFFSVDRVDPGNFQAGLTQDFMEEFCLDVEAALVLVAVDWRL